MWNPFHIEAFADRDGQPGWHRLNAQTQNDIDFKELFWDHTNSRIGQQFLQPGPLQTRNGIRIPEMIDYPQAIIEDAENTSRDLSSI